MGKVFLWKAGDSVVVHTDLKAAAQLDGLSRQPDKTVTGEQFSAAGGLARIIDGKIFLGRTAKEAADEAVLRRIGEIDARFGIIEREMVRPIMAHIKGSPSAADAAKLGALDAEAAALRTERAGQVQSLSIPF
ncbi:MAG: hypothetical protein LBK61_02130 [Spirochaetaceae bacterium]|nr:hypothetical protein [Spirochaetaceae bacterium]